MSNSEQMVERKTWDEFRAAGLLWWLNRALHLFGWAIVFEINTEKDGPPLEVYPARVRYRGFSPEIETDGFRRLSQYMRRHADELLQECDK